MLSEFRAFSSVVGRRTALRYAGLGLLAATLAACRRDAPAAPSVAALTLDAFANGTWVLSMPDRTGELTVDAGRWTLSPGIVGPDAAEGEYTLSGDSVEVVRRAGGKGGKQLPISFDRTYTGSELPAEVGGSGDWTVSWSLGGRYQKCRVRWDGRSLVVEGHDWHGRDVAVTLTRKA